MPLPVGELARRCRLTVRTQHHYDAIGLLRPSLRSDAGYRLYGRANVERLHRIQALRQLGLSLADIGTVLSGPEQPLGDLIDRQIAQLDQELARATRLRGRLVTLRGQLAAGQSPDLADWLDTLELMTMYEKYFSPEELEQLPMHHDRNAHVEWQALVGAVQAAIDRGARPQDHDAQLLALRWMQTLQRDTAGNPDFLRRLNAMHDSEPGMVALSGITPAVKQFVEQASVEARLAIYARYLEPHELAFMREHYHEQMYAWPPLIAELRKVMAAGVSPSSPEAQALAGRWMTMFRTYAGDDPATHARIREANMKEPDLMNGTWVDEALLAYLSEAAASPL